MHYLCVLALLLLNFDCVILDRLSPIGGKIVRRDANYITQIIQSDWSSFEELLKPIAVKRVSGSQEIQTVKNFIASKLESYGWRLEYDTFTDTTPYGEKSFTNIIATYDIGRTFTKRDAPLNQDQFHLKNRVVFACHYDSKYFENTEFIGAIDSAVPCAILLEMAKFLKDNFDKTSFYYLNRHIQFYFFDGEEAFKDWTSTDSIYGSRHYAGLLNSKYSQNSFDSIDLFVLLDLIGGDRSQFLNYFPQTSHVYSRLSQIENKLRAKNLLSETKPYYFTDLNGYNGIYRHVEDDHKPFLSYDVPVLHLIPNPFPSQWHKKTDTVQNLNLNHVNDVRLIMKYFLCEILHVSMIR